MKKSIKELIRRKEKFYTEEDIIKRAMIN